MTFWMPPIAGTVHDRGSRCSALSVEYDTRCVREKGHPGDHVALDRHYPFTPQGLADSIDAEAMLKIDAVMARDADRESWSPS